MLTHALGLGILFAVAALALLVILTWHAIHDVTRPPRRTFATALARGRPGDPADLGFIFTSWTMTRRSIELPVWDIEGRDPIGVIAVLVHDWASGRVELLDQLEMWAPWSRRILLYDRRGHGDAQGGPGTLGAGEDDDLVEVIRGAGGDGPVVLVGASMAGALAIRAAAACDLVTGVVAFAPCLDVRDAIRRRRRAAGLPTWPFTNLGFTCLRVGDDRTSTLDAAKSLGRQLLVVHGELDTEVPVDEGRRFAEAAGAGFVLAEGAGNGVSNDDPIPAEIESFLRERCMIER